MSNFDNYEDLYGEEVIEFFIKFYLSHISLEKMIDKQKIVSDNILDTDISYKRSLRYMF